MPANVTPEYRKAEEWYRSASTDEEKLMALEEMLRTIPKHKGTDHMQADIKRRMSKLRSAAESGKKGAVKHVDLFHVPRTGAGQVVLIGAPNAGKSALVAALSNAKVTVADYPFSSDKPVPGMARHEDVPIELVDMPPITPEYAPPGMVNTCRNADLLAIVVDLAGPVLDQMETCIDYLRQHRLLPEATTPGTDETGNTLARPTFVICTKADLAQPGDVETLRELIEHPFEYLEVSAETGQGLKAMMARIFEMLDIVRVYAKKPGKEPDMTEPFTLDRGATVTDLAYKVHRELADKLKTARAWNSPTAHDGQNVPRDHILADKEIIELHFD